MRCSIPWGFLSLEEHSNHRIAQFWLPREHIVDHPLQCEQFFETVPFQLSAVVAITGYWVWPHVRDRWCAFPDTSFGQQGSADKGTQSFSGSMLTSFLFGNPTHFFRRRPFAGRRVGEAQHPGPANGPPLNSTCW